MNKKNSKFLKILFIFYFLISFRMTANEKSIDFKEHKTETFRNLITFSGPMGTGLAKSYENGDHKYCVYNTINGKKTISSKNLYFECPKEYKNK